MKTLKGLLFLYCQLFLVGCLTENKSACDGYSAQLLLRKIVLKSPYGYQAGDTLSFSVKKASLLEAYNRSCGLHLNMDEIVVQAYRTVISRGKINDRYGNVITMDAIQFINYKQAKRVYQLLLRKVKELQHLRREDLGQFCIWPYELQIHNVQQKNCVLLLINVMGDVNSSEKEYYYNCFERLP